MQMFFVSGFLDAEGDKSSACMQVNDHQVPFYNSRRVQSEDTVIIASRALRPLFHKKHADSSIDLMVY